MQWKIITELYRHFLTDQMQLYQRYFSWARIYSFSIINFVIVQATVFSFNQFFCFLKASKVREGNVIDHVISNQHHICLASVDSSEI